MCLRFTFFLKALKAFCALVGSSQIFLEARWETAFGLRRRKENGGGWAGREARLRVRGKAWGSAGLKKRGDTASVSPP